jgi:hypothetical protein
VRAKRNKSLWLCHRLITNQPPDGRLREAQKSLKKKNCLSTES